MNGREDKKQNDLFFVCSLIGYIARQTKNKRKVVVNAFGKEELEHLYGLADIYYSENIDKLTHELVNKYHIHTGIFDNVAACQYWVPTHWDMGKVYRRLVIDVCQSENNPVIDTLIEIYNFWIPDSLDDYNSSMYYENQGYLFTSYKAGQPL